MKADCIFCKIVNKEISSPIVHEDETTIAFNDINPQAPVHIIVIPKRHIERVSELTADDSDLISRVIFAGNKIAKEKGLAESGYRFVLNCNRDAGQVVFHIHMHLLGGRKMSWPPG